MRKKAAVFRGLRKSAYLSRKVFSKGANFSGRVEQKADRIINGTDTRIQIHEKMLFEKYYSEALPEITPIYPALPRSARQRNVTLFIPSLQKSSFFGGTATALIVAAMLANDLESPLRIVETLKHGGARKDEILAFLKSSDVPLQNTEVELVNLAGRTYINYGYLEIHPDDVYIASAWWDAHLLDRLPLSKPYVYLIQDYEPIFYNNSDRYILSENTYASTRYIPVCNTKLMYDFMCNKGYSHIKNNGMWFEPAVATPLKKNTHTPDQKKRLFLYGRPSVDRNLFFMALSCLNQAFDDENVNKGEWELFMAGQDNLPDVTLNCGLQVQNKGKMALDEYYRFIDDIQVAVSPMMAPHPNYPTLEFASRGSLVVTTRYELKKDLSNYSDNILMCDLTYESMTQSILAALKQSAQGQAARKSAIPSDWNKALAATIKQTVKTLTTS